MLERPAPPDDGRVVEARPRSTTAGTVLVVDDEEGVRDSVRAVLEDSCEVLLDGETARRR